MKKLFNILILLALLVLIALVPGCGTRKVNLKTEKTEIKNEQSGNTESSKESKSGQSSSSETERKTDTENTYTKTTEHTNYDKDTGKPTGYTKTSETGKSRDNSTEKNKTVKEAYLHDVEKLRIVTVTRNSVKSANKEKATSTNRNGLFVLGGFGLLILGVLAWLKWVRK